MEYLTTVVSGNDPKGSGHCATRIVHLSRTPPTPTSAPLTTVNGVAFSFDWMPEQFVPVADAAHHNSNSNNHMVPVGPSHSHSVLSAHGAAAVAATTTMSTAPLSASPNEHKFYNLDRSPENAIIRGTHDHSSSSLLVKINENKRQNS